MALGRKFKLNTGHEIPAVGLGTWVRTHLAKPYANDANISVFSDSNRNQTRSKKQFPQR
jgi:diketogulonate reductase-like aldo/keto reductase